MWIEVFDTGGLSRDGHALRGIAHRERDIHAGVLIDHQSDPFLHEISRSQAFWAGDAIFADGQDWESGYEPVSSVVAERVNEVATFRAVTSTPGTAAPD